MKFTVLCITLLSISASISANTGQVQKTEESKGKREAETSYQSSNSHQSLQEYQTPSFSKGDASAVSIGAGYSIGGAKPSFSYGAPESTDLQSSNHATVQLAPITLHPSNGGIISGDLSQFMSELSHGLNTGAITLSPYPGEQSAQGHSILSQLTSGGPANHYQIREQPEAAVPHYAAGVKGLGSYSSNGPVLFQPSSGHPQPTFSYVDPSSGSYGELSNLAASGHSPAGLSLGEAGHAAVMFLGGTGHSMRGLAIGSSGSGHSHSSSGHSFGGTGHSIGSSGHSIGSSGHSLDGFGHSHSLGGSGHSHSLGGSGHSYGNSGHSVGSSGQSFGSSGHPLAGLGHVHSSFGYSFPGSGHSVGASSGLSLGSGYVLGGHSLGESGHSLGGSGYGSGGHSSGGPGLSFGGPLKGFSGRHAFPNKPSFKPSTLLGVYSDSTHGLSSLSGSGSYGGPSFGSHSGHGLSLSSGGHGLSFGSSSSKIPQSYLVTKPESYSQDSYAAHSHRLAASPPGTTYGIPQASYIASAAHSASDHSPQYVYSSVKSLSPSHYGKASSSYKAPSSSHGSLSSLSSHAYSSGPKYVFGGNNSKVARYASSGSEDSHGAHSETTYNTIKYSEEIKPRMH